MKLKAELTLYRVTDAMKAVLSIVGLKTFDAVVPNEIGGLNSIEALLASQRFGKSVLDTDLVARAYPMIWQTVRCLTDIPVTPAALANGAGIEKVQCQYTPMHFISLYRSQLFPTAGDNEEAENLMRNASSELGSLAGACTNPIYGVEAKTLPKNSFSWGEPSRKYFFTLTDNLFCSMDYWSLSCHLPRSQT